MTLPNYTWPTPPAIPGQSEAGDHVEGAICEECCCCCPAAGNYAGITLQPGELSGWIPGLPSPLTPTPPLQPLPPSMGSGIPPPTVDPVPGVGKLEQGRGQKKKKKKGGKTSADPIDKKSASRDGPIHGMHDLDNLKYKRKKKKRRVIRQGEGAKTAARIARKGGKISKREMGEIADQVGGVIPRPSSDSDVGDITEFTDRAKRFMPRWGWVDTEAEAFVTGHIERIAKDKKGWITIDIKIDELLVTGRGGPSYSPVPLPEGEPNLIRIELHPKAQRTNKVHRVCQDVTVKGRFKWDQDGHWEIHPWSDWCICPVTDSPLWKDYYGLTPRKPFMLGGGGR